MKFLASLATAFVFVSLIPSISHAACSGLTYSISCSFGGETVDLGSTCSGREAMQTYNIVSQIWDGNCSLYSRVQK